MADVADTKEQRVSLVPHESGDINENESRSRFAKLTESVGLLRNNVVQAFSTAKPMNEVFDMSMVSKPQNFNEAVARLRTNASYFKTNYGMLTAGTTALVMLMNPWSLIVLAFLAIVWFYMYIIKAGNLVLGGREFSERETFWLLSGSSVFVIFFLTSVGATIFYSLGLSMLMIGFHAAMRVPDDATLFSDEVPAEGGSLAGLLSMFRPKISEFTGSNTV